jgi:membrane protein implicated in regulation of membrane protease activity
MNLSTIWQKIKRIPWWGWLIIAVTSPCWLALLIFFALPIAAVAVVAFIFLMVARPRRKHVRVTGRGTIKSTVRATGGSTGSSTGNVGRRNPYRA